MRKISIGADDRANYRRSLDIFKKSVRRGYIEMMDCAFVSAFMWGQMEQFVSVDEETSLALQSLEKAFDQLSSIAERLENGSKQSD